MSSLVTEHTAAAAAVASREDSGRPGKEPADA
jgi:hypothetical protein